jgi:anti-sigma regulatory factor (Ser/Thr protein kinase)
LGHQERLFPASPAVVPAIRHWIEGLVAHASFGDVKGEFALAVSEAAANAIRHSGSSSLAVRWSSDGNQAMVEVSDQGVFDQRAITSGEVGGFGLPLMAAVMDEVSIERGSPERPGTMVRLVKRKP